MDVWRNMVKGSSREDGDHSSYSASEELKQLQQSLQSIMNNQA